MITEEHFLFPFALIILFYFLLPFLFPCAMEDLHTATLNLETNCPEWKQIRLQHLQSNFFLYQWYLLITEI